MYKSFVSGLIGFVAKLNSLSLAKFLDRIIKKNLRIEKV